MTDQPAPAMAQQLSEIREKLAHELALWFAKEYMEPRRAPTYCVAHMTERIESTLRQFEAAAPAPERALQEALAGLMKLIDNGELVRDTSHDHEPTYALRAINFVTKLKAAQEALAEAALTDKDK